MAGALISLAPALTLGLLAFAALGSQSAALGIPAALVTSSVGGAVYALLSRGPMAAGGPATPPVLVMGALVARVAADPAFVASDPAAMAQLLALVAVAVVSMGLCQIGLGLSGLVRFAKFVPQPVLGGFMNGVALLALLALLPWLVGWPVGALQSDGWRALTQVQPATLAVGAVTVALIFGLPHLSPRLPATLIGLLGGAGTYAALQTAFPQAAMGPLTGDMQAAWPNALVLSPVFTDTAAVLMRKHIGAALSAGLVMALIGTLDLLLSGLALDQHCRTRTDPRRDVMALGAANVVAGLVGGLPLALLRARALHMLRVGGRSSGSLIICCALFMMLGVWATPLLSLLPKAVLSGVMIYVCVLMADRWSLQLLAEWWRGPRTPDMRQTLAVVAVVCAVTVLLGFPTAVAIGALLSVLLFIRGMNRSLVRHRFTAESQPSRRVYSAADEARLKTLRARITVLELEGALFFGSADRIANVADDLEPACDTLVLDFRRVSLIDDSGAMVLLQTCQRLEEHGRLMLLANLMAHSRNNSILMQFAGRRFVTDHSAADTDQAIETAELRLLAQAGIDPLHATVALDQVGLMEGMDAAQRARLAACMPERRLASGECLFREGEPGDRLYVVTAGSISIFGTTSPDPAAPRPRYVTLPPGMMLGETAMLDGNGRSGDAVAVGDSVVHELDRRAIESLRVEDPALYAMIHHNIAIHLAQRLRAAAWAWRASVR